MPECGEENLLQGTAGTQVSRLGRGDKLAEQAATAELGFRAPWPPSGGQSPPASASKRKPECPRSRPHDAVLGKCLMKNHPKRLSLIESVLQMLNEYIYFLELETGA